MYNYCNRVPRDLLFKFCVFCLFFESSETQKTPVCKNGGYLNTSENTCECDWRFIGVTCEIQACFHGGIPKNSTVCTCDWGWRGELCETPLFCSHGTLIKGACKCDPHWSGGLCNFPICGNGFAQLDGTCKCYPGHRGLFCQTSFSCAHGNLSELENRCVCQPGYSQPDCDSCLQGFRYSSLTSFGDLAVNACVPIINDTSIPLTLFFDDVPAATVVSRVGWIVLCVLASAVLVSLVIAGVWWKKYRKPKKVGVLSLRPSPNNVDQDLDVPATRNCDETPLPVENDYLQREVNDAANQTNVHVTL